MLAAAWCVGVSFIDKDAPRLAEGEVIVLVDTDQELPGGASGVSIPHCGGCLVTG